METPFFEFLRLIRRMAIVVMMAWLILGAARMLRLEPARDPFAPPSPPFQAVSSSGGAQTTIAQRDWIEKTALVFVHHVQQMILYAPR